MKRIAIDTNVLVRLVLDEQSEQSDLAAELARQFQLFISKTVLLETEWVLRSVAGLARQEINDELVALLETRGIEVEAENAVYRALGAHRNGADFADALHVVGAEGQAGVFATFDRSLVNRASQSFSETQVLSCRQLLNTEPQQEDRTP